MHYYWKIEKQIALLSVTYIKVATTPQWPESEIPNPQSTITDKFRASSLTSCWRSLALGQVGRPSPISDPSLPACFQTRRDSVERGSTSWRQSLQQEIQGCWRQRGVSLQREGGGQVAASCWGHMRGAWSWLKPPYEMPLYGEIRLSPLEVYTCVQSVS